MNVYDEAMSEEKRNAHRGVIQKLNRSVTRSAPKPSIPQVVEKVGVPDRTTLNRFRLMRSRVCHACGMSGQEDVDGGMVLSDDFGFQGCPSEIEWIPRSHHRQSVSCRCFISRTLIPLCPFTDFEKSLLKMLNSRATVKLVGSDSSLEIQIPRIRIGARWIMRTTAFSQIIEPEARTE